MSDVHSFPIILQPLLQTLQSVTLSPKPVILLMPIVLPSSFYLPLCASMAIMTYPLSLSGTLNTSKTQTTTTYPPFHLCSLTSIGIEVFVSFTQASLVPSFASYAPPISVIPFIPVIFTPLSPQHLAPSRCALHVPIAQ